MAASSYEEARAAFIQERPTYKELTLRSCALLDEGLKAAGIRAEVTGRAKDVDSFVKKLLSKPDYASGERPIQDKAGVRIALPYFGDEPAVEAVIRERFEVDEREATIDRLGVDKLGYLAVHYILRPKVECLSEEERTLFAGLQVEVQVGSLAQRAWAEVSHELLYKPAVDPPPVYKRVINRLMALVEVFDEEVERARDAIAALPGFEENQILNELERELLRFASRLGNRELSQIVTPPLVDLYRLAPARVYPDALRPWIEESSERLAEFFRADPGTEDVHPLLYQPETFLILERSENDPDGLKAAWPDAVVPRDLLISLTELWGRPVT